LHARADGNGETSSTDKQQNSRLSLLFSLLSEMVLCLQKSPLASQPFSEEIIMLKACCTPVQENLHGYEPYD
ncbi:hypothetical protein PO909_028359, partial [Leuciscus waleckii]